MSTVKHTLAGKGIPTPVIGAVAGVGIRLCEKCVVYVTTVDDTLPQSKTEDVAIDTLTRVVGDHSSCIFRLEAGQLLTLEGRVAVGISAWA